MRTKNGDVSKGYDILGNWERFKESAASDIFGLKDDTATQVLLTIMEAQLIYHLDSITKKTYKSV